MERAPEPAGRPFLERHEFLIRRLHSLTGLVPVGAYMVVHLTTNASVLDSPNTFQRAVYMIHSLGTVLPLVEWGLIFLPLLFHAIIGVVIVRGGLPNSGTYRYVRNVRYTLQRATGMIAFIFILYHVFHMHGWFHFEWWTKGVAEPLGGAQFKPYNAASSLGAAMSGFVVPLLYAVGVLSCVFHLANGLWTMGITWGIWVSPAAQRRADLVCGAFGLGLAVLSMGALTGAVRVDEEKAKLVEDRMYEAKTAAQEVTPNEHKRSRTSPVTEASADRRSAGHAAADAGAAGPAATGPAAAGAGAVVSPAVPAKTAAVRTGAIQAGAIQAGAIQAGAIQAGAIQAGDEATPAAPTVASGSRDPAAKR